MITVLSPPYSTPKPTITNILIKIFPFYINTTINLLSMSTRFVLSCRRCKCRVSEHAVQAMLISNPKIKLFSSARCMNVLIDPRTYITRTCKCFIREILCINCVSCVGYHVTQPCLFCLRRNSNGHLFMFNFGSVRHMEHREQGSMVVEIEREEEIRLR